MENFTNAAIDRRKDRRKGPDLLIKIITWGNLGGWVLFIAAIIFFDLAKPRFTSFYEGNTPGRFDLRWDPVLFNYVLYFMLASLALSLFGLFCNFRRHRRKKDQYRISLFLLALISFFGIIYCIIIM